MSTDIPTDSVDRWSINLNNMSTDTRSTLSRYIGRASAGMSADCRSTSWPIVSTDTWSTDALSTHYPRNLQSITLLVLVCLSGNNKVNLQSHEDSFCCKVTGEPDQILSSDA